MTTTPPRPDAHSGLLIRREEIIEAARIAIEEHGPDASTGQIVERCGLDRPNLYRHFSGKDELDLAVARSAYQELRAEVRTRLDLSGTPLDVVRAPIAAQVMWADNHRNLYRFLIRQGYQPGFQRRKLVGRDFAAELAQAGARYFPRFADDANAAEVTMIGLIGLVETSALWWLGRPTETRERLIDRLTGQAWLLIDHHLRRVGVQLDPAVPLPSAGDGHGVGVARKLQGHRASFMAGRDRLG